MKIRVTLAVLVLGGLTLLTGCGDKDTSKAAAPPPATSRPQTTEPQSEDTPTAPESEESKPAASGDAKEFCKKLASKAEDMGTGKQASELEQRRSLHPDRDRRLDELGLRDVAADARRHDLSVRVVVGRWCADPHDHRPGSRSELRRHLSSERGTTGDRRVCVQ